MSQPFPNILHCLVCEDTRLEQGGLLTITGFYGVLPNFSILVKDFELPISRLTFVFIAGPAQGNYSIGLEIKGKDGKLIFPSALPPFEMSFDTTEGRFVQVIIGIGNLKFPGPGKYHLELSVDGKSHFQDRLDVRSFAEDKDFKKLLS